MITQIWNVGMSPDSINNIASPWSFSHVGLYVKDLDRMAAFYLQAFSMVETDAGPARVTTSDLTRDAREHHQVVLETSRTTDETTIQQLSFRFNCLDDLRLMKARIENLPDDVLSEDMLPYGVNHGNAWSLYCHDPEGNRIEMFLDSPFYVRQPCIDKLISLTDAEILKATIDAFGDDVATRPWKDWSNELAINWRRTGPACE